MIGLGGGKSLDSAKGVAVLLDRPMFTVPTIASNESPTSASIAIYDDHHVMIAVDRMERNPELVLVDAENGEPVAPIAIHAADGRELGWHDLAWQKREDVGKGGPACC